MATAEPLAAVLMRGLMKLNRRARAARRATDLSLSAAAILGALKRLGPMPAARLAEDQRLKPQSLSRLIADLEAQGMISRQPGVVDRRLLVLRITPGGSKALSDEIRIRRAWLAQALRGLSDDEREILRKAAALMEQLAERAGHHDGDGKA